MAQGLLELFQRDAAVSATSYVVGLTARENKLSWRTTNFRASHLIASALRASSSLVDVGTRRSNPVANPTQVDVVAGI